MFERRSRDSTFRQTSWLAVLLVVLVVAAYTSVWKAGFIWDDDQHLTANPCIVGPLGLREIWITSAANYFPLVLTSFAAMHRLFGLDPVVYHAANLLLHVANTLLLWGVLRRLRVRGAWLGAALWGLHPVMAETVGWVSEATNTQSSFFFLLSLLAFLRWLGEPSGRRGIWWYGAALAAAAAALLSKPSTVMLPGIFILCWWWLRIPWRWQRLAGLIPFFVFSAAWSCWTVWEQKVHSRATGADWNLSGPQRVLLAGKVLVFYFGRLIWPHALSFIYPRWTPLATNLASYVPLTTVLVVASLLYCGRVSLRPVVFAAGAFAGLLFPVMGFFDVYYFRFSFVADHFQYLAAMAPLALIGAAMTGLMHGRMAWLQWGAAVALLGGLGVLTARRAAGLVDEKTLWTTTLAQNPDCWMARNNLGLVFEREPDGESRAIAQYKAALALKPDYVEAHTNLGNALAKQPHQGAIAEAEYEAALRIDPDNVQAHYNFANFLLAQPGRRESAMVHYQAVLRVNPRFAPAEYNLGVAQLAASGRMAEALPHFEAAMRLWPNEAGSHAGFAELLSRDPTYVSRAIDEYETALRLNPNLFSAHNNLAVLYAQKGDLVNAARQLEMAVRLEPGNTEARENLAEVRAALARRP